MDRKKIVKFNDFSKKMKLMQLKKEFFTQKCDF